MEALERLHTTVTKANKVNPKINFEVFIHKVHIFSPACAQRLSLTSTSFNCIIFKG